MDHSERNMPLLHEPWTWGRCTCQRGPTQVPVVVCSICSSSTCGNCGRHTTCKRCGIYLCLDCAAEHEEEIKLCSVDPTLQCDVCVDVRDDLSQRCALCRRLQCYSGHRSECRSEISTYQGCHNDICSRSD